MINKRGSPERNARLDAAQEVAKNLPNTMPTELAQREELMYFLAGCYEGALWKLGWKVRLERHDENIRLSEDYLTNLKEGI